MSREGVGMEPNERRLERFCVVASGVMSVDSLIEDARLALPSPVRFLLLRMVMVDGTTD